MRISILAAALVLSGCAVNGFAKYYTPKSGVENIAAIPYYVPSPNVPKLYAHSDDVKADLKRLAEDGYVLIGTSSFLAPEIMGTKAQAIAQAKKLHAAIVMVKSSYRDTLSGTYQYSVPNPTQTVTVNTSGTVSSFSNGAYSSDNYSGTGTVTIPGGSTTYNAPYTFTRSDFFASYWVACDPSKMRLGINAVPLPDDVRERLKRNTGVFIPIVVRGTPAFRANILEGDVVVKINAEEVVDVQGYSEQVKRFAGQTVDLGVIRGAEAVSIRVSLNPNPT